MELDVSLELLELDENATLDEAEQAYQRVQQLVVRYYQEVGDTDADIRRADLETLSRAYERVRTHLSGNSESAKNRPRLRVVRDMSVPDPSAAAFSPAAPESDLQMVEATLAAIYRRLHETEAELPEARRIVDTMAATVDTASRHHEQARQESINAIVAAKSAKIRAMVLEMEVKRAMEKAVAVTEKAKKRVEAARAMAMAAQVEAEKARDEVDRLKKFEEMAAFEAMNAERQLDQARTHLKTLTHDLVETRNRMKTSLTGFVSDEDNNAGRRDFGGLFSDLADLSGMGVPLDHGADLFMGPSAGSPDFAYRDEFSAADTAKPAAPALPPDDAAASRQPEAERRRMARIAYPPHARPLFLMEGRTFSVLDLSGAGMKLEMSRTEGAFFCPQLVRGTLNFPDQSPIQVTGKVVRETKGAVGLRLVTRIGNTILAEERKRLIVGG